MYSVMIVEDEVNILNHIYKMASSIGSFSVEGAFSKPEEALEAFRGIMPDVVFLDVEMPRTSGIELSRKMLDQKPDLWIVFLTAYSHYAVNAFEVGAIDYLMKPVMKDDLERVVKRLDKLGRRKQERANPQKEQSTFPVCCFGCFDVRDVRQQLIKWPTKRTEEVFAYFLVRQGKYVSKWELLELFWPELEENRALNNLYNTIYRIKKVLRLMPLSPQIQKMNGGYILEAKRKLSDLGQFLEFLEVMKQNKGNTDFSAEASLSLFFSYATPLFGTRDYFWSLHVQKYAAEEYGKLCHKLLLHYYEKNQFAKGEEIIQYYAEQHIEDEEMLQVWLRLAANWKGHETAAEKYRNWFNEKLKEAELPLLKKISE